MNIRFIANTQCFEQKVEDMKNVKDSDIARILSQIINHKRDRSYVNLVKHGKRTVDAQTALAFAQILDVPVDQLFTPTDKDNPETSNETA